MQAIIDFFDACINGLIAIVDFVLQTIKDIAYMVTLVGQTVAEIPSYLGLFIPSQIVTALMLIFSVVVIYKILGREG